MSDASRELRALCLPAFARRLVLAIVLLTTGSGAAIAAGDSVSSIVVTFRNDWGAPALAERLPASARQALTATLGAGIGDAYLHLFAHTM